MVLEGAAKPGGGATCDCASMAAFFALALAAKDCPDPEYIGICDVEAEASEEYIFDIVRTGDWVSMCTRGSRRIPSLIYVISQLELKGVYNNAFLRLVRNTLEI